MKNHYRLLSTYHPLKSYAPSTVKLFLSVNFQANELNVVLTDQAQQIPHLAEKKCQLKVFYSLSLN